MKLWFARICRVKKAKKVKVADFLTPNRNCETEFFNSWVLNRVFEGPNCSNIDVLGVKLIANFPRNLKKAISILYDGTGSGEIQNGGRTQVWELDSFQVFSIFFDVNSEYTEEKCFHYFLKSKYNGWALKTIFLLCVPRTGARAEKYSFSNFTTPGVSIGRIWGHFRILRKILNQLHPSYNLFYANWRFFDKKTDFFKLQYKKKSWKFEENLKRSLECFYSAQTCSKNMCRWKRSPWFEFADRSRNFGLLRNAIAPIILFVNC